MDLDKTDEQIISEHQLDILRYVSRNDLKESAELRDYNGRIYVKFGSLGFDITPLPVDETRVIFAQINGVYYADIPEEGNVGILALTWHPVRRVWTIGVPDLGGINFDRIQ